MPHGAERNQRACKLSIEFVIDFAGQAACPPEWRRVLQSIISAPLIPLVNALDESRGFELVHKGIIDGIFDPNVGDFRIDLGHQLVQPLHSFNVWYVALARRN